MATKPHTPMNVHKRTFSSDPDMSKKSKVYPWNRAKFSACQPRNNKCVSSGALPPRSGYQVMYSGDANFVSCQLYFLIVFYCDFVLNLCPKMGYNGASYHSLFTIICSTYFFFYFKIFHFISDEWNWPWSPHPPISGRKELGWRSVVICYRSQ